MPTPTEPTETRPPWWRDWRWWLAEFGWTNRAVGWCQVAKSLLLMGAFFMTGDLLLAAVSLTFWLFGVALIEIGEQCGRKAKGTKE